MMRRTPSSWTLLVVIPLVAMFSLSCPDEQDDDDDSYGEDDDDDDADDDGADDDVADDDGADDDLGDDDNADGPEPGEIVFAEVMQNPAAAEDLDGEWFELLNTTGSSRELHGCVVHDGNNDAHTISGSLVIGGDDRLVLGRNTNTTVNGNVPVDYDYNGISLNNGADALILTCDEVEIDRIEWDGGPVWPHPTGASMIVDEAFLDDNDDGANWCESTSVIPGGTDLATPGMPNDECDPVMDDDTGDDDDSTPSAAFTEPERGWRIRINHDDDDDGEPVRGWRLRLRPQR